MSMQSEICQKIRELYKMQKRQISRSEELADMMEKAGRMIEAQTLRDGALQYLEFLLKLEEDMVKKCGGAVLEFRGRRVSRGRSSRGSRRRRGSRKRSNRGY